LAEVDHVAAAVGRADRQHVGVRRGIGQRAADAVADGGDQDGPARVCVRDRLSQHRRAAQAGQRHVDDVCAVVGGPADTLGDIRVVSVARRVENLHRQDADPTRNTSDSLVVAGLGRHHSGDRRAVAVVIDPYGARPRGVVAGQNPTGQVRMVGGHPGVDHCDDEIRSRHPCQGPGFGPAHCLEGGALCLVVEHVLAGSPSP
jgi:hypothetical protein